MMNGRNNGKKLMAVRSTFLESESSILIDMLTKAIVVAHAFEIVIPP
jgi:hypothetical protein